MHSSIVTLEEVWGGGRSFPKSDPRSQGCGRVTLPPMCLMQLKTFVFPGHAGKDAKGQIGQATVALQEGFGECCPGEWTPGISPTLGHLQVGETITGHRGIMDHLEGQWSDTLVALSLMLIGEHVFAGLEEHTRQAMMKRDFPGLLGDQPPSTLPQPEKGCGSSSSSSSSSEFCLCLCGMVVTQGTSWCFERQMPKRLSQRVVALPCR